MAPTQFDVIRRQSEAAVHNEINRAVAAVRRDTSLVNQAMGLLGRNPRESERAARGGRSGKTAPRRDPGVHVVETKSAPARPASDGYVRRSPVQPLYEAAGYRRSLILRAVGVTVLILAAGAGIYFLMRLGLFGR